MLMYAPMHNLLSSSHTSSVDKYKYIFFLNSYNYYLIYIILMLYNLYVTCYVWNSYYK